MSSVSDESLRSFRRNAVHVRHALESFGVEEGRVQVDGGYLQDSGLVERYKRISIPVRRALNPTDRASFAQALAALREASGVANMPAIEAAWAALQKELDSLVGLGGGKVPRRQILEKRGGRSGDFRRQGRG